MKTNTSRLARLTPALVAAFAGAALTAHAAVVAIETPPTARPATLTLDPRPSTLRIPAPALPAADAKVRSEATFVYTYLPAGATTNWGATCEDFPAPARAALEYASRLWAVHIAWSVPIRLDACWTPLPAGELALATPYSYAVITGGTVLPFINTLYPEPLVHALYHFPDSTYRQGVVAFNATPGVPWHFGTDANPGAAIDLVSAAMSSLGHLLGFDSFAYVANGLGQIRLGNYPAVYDRFTKDGAGVPLTDYAENSAALAAALQSGGIHFHGANAKAANGGNPVPLYSPSVFSRSSQRHLADGYDGTPDALMTRSLAVGEAVHRPGPITLGMLKDMGWTMNTVATVADFAVTHTASVATTLTGRDVKFTIEVQNLGPDSVANAIAWSDFDMASTAVWTSAGCFLEWGSHYTCPLGNLAPGATARASIVLRNAAAGTMRHTASAWASGNSDPDHSNESNTLNLAVTASPAAAPVQRYRLYSPVTLEHHFTTDANEYATLGTYIGTWVQEGGVGKVLDNPGAYNGVTATPYYRLYNTGNAQHHWTTDANEYYTLAQFPQFNAEGIGCWILPTQAAGTIPLYRLLYPFTVPVAGLHHWTIDPNEYNALIASYGWVGEGGSGFVIP